MLNIDSLLLDAFYKENKDFFENARVQKIQQPTRREIILHLRNKAESRKLYININPNFYHLCFMSKENEQRRNISIPKQPPMFCMLLRKHMEGAKILKVQKPDFERILELTFENYNELGDRIEECLSIELMGKHSNIVLYNTDNNIILGCAHNIGEEKSRERELAGGLPYIYPPKQNKRNLLKTRFELFEKCLLKSSDNIKKTISSNYFSLSQAVIEEICSLKEISPEKSANQTTEKERQILFIELHELLSNTHYSYTVSSDYKKFSCISKLDIKYSNINEMIDDYFSFHLEQSAVKSLKNLLKAKIDKELKKLKNTYSNQKKQLEKSDKLEIYKLKGNLLTANAYMLKSGEKTVSLKDFETGSLVDIELDENKTPIENAQRYFTLYNKYKKAIQIALEMSEKTKVEIDYYNQLLYDVEISTSVDELEQIKFEIVQEDEVASKKKKDETMKITKLEVDGSLVYIGKNNKQNDYLYSKISSPEDIWFHTLNTPGSHIIVKPQNYSQKFHDETILKIARLAKQYSTAKNALKAAVVYTKRKYVKRPNNTKSGFVVYKNETEIMVD